MKIGSYLTTRYAAGFGRVRRRIELREGFVLLPVMVPGRDVADALADYLRSSEVDVETIAPRMGDEWRAFVADLLAAAERLGQHPNANKALFVVGSEGVTAESRAALRLLNQRRETFRRTYTGTLVLCGTTLFLDATAEMAPDFWSVRASTVRLVPVSDPGLEAPSEGWRAIRPSASVDDDTLWLRYNDALVEDDWATAVETALSLADRLGRVSRFSDARSLLQENRRRFARRLTRVHKARLLLLESRLLQVLGQVSDLEGAYRKCLSWFRAAEDRLGEANTLQALGDLYVRTDRLKDAEEAYRKALPIYEDIEDRLGEANTLQGLGSLYVRTARLKDAEDAYKKALSINEAVEDRLGAANTLRALGDLYVRTDRLKDAEEAYRKALRIYQDIEARLGEANARGGLGRLALARGDARGAFRLFSAARAGLLVIEDRFGVAGQTGYMALAALAGGRPDRAIVLGAIAVEELSAIGDRFGQFVALDDLSQAFAAIEDTAGSVSAAILALHLAESIGDASAPERRRLLALAVPSLAEREGIPEGLVEEATALFGRFVASVRARLEERGEDVFAPWDEGE